MPHIKEIKPGFFALYEGNTYIKYIGKDIKPFLRDLERSKEAAKHPELLALKGSVSGALAEKQRQQIKKVIISSSKYHAIVIDPPWPMEKILRNERPNQSDFDYATMTIREIKDLPISIMASGDGCHVYLWTTQRFLPFAFEIMEEWGVKYQCLMTWVKNVGFTPFSWMYSTEHCLFGRIGSLPLLKMGMRLDFQAKVREHSRKPDEFYELVKLVSPEPRYDMFSREKRDGFEQHGNETDKFTA